ncbi:hypothetical protein D3C71_1186380 [compost metagenome]
MAFSAACRPGLETSPATFCAASCITFTCSTVNSACLRTKAVCNSIISEKDLAPINCSIWESDISVLVRSASIAFKPNSIEPAWAEWIVDSTVREASSAAVFILP